MTKKEIAPETKNFKFEDSLKKLEKIVERLEGGDAALDESIALYEEGITLFRQCSAKLDEAKKKVEILTKKSGSDKLTPAPFKRDSDKASTISADDDSGDEPTEDGEKEELPF